MIQTLRKNAIAKVAIIFFILLTLWWVEIGIKGIRTEQENYLFGGIYGSMALIGGIAAFITARHWGGIKSVMGQAILMISLGLLFQTFGQYVFWYYNFFAKIEIPYPSIADIGYFGSIPCYIYAGILFSKASGVKVSLKQLSGQLQIILIPLGLLAASYFIFAQKYQLDFNQPLKTLLDYGYPLGQALYISFAILTFSLSRGVLGGIMKHKIMFILLAFLAQYVADFSFLFFQDVYYNASIIDYLYLIAYLCMVLAITQLNSVITQLRQS